MILEFFAKLVDHGFNGHGARVTENADRHAFHVRAHIEDHVEVLHSTVPMLDAMQDLVHPPGAFTALRTLPAGFLSIEACGPPGEFHDAGGFVDDHATGRTQKRSFFRQGIKVHANVDLIGFQNRH